MFKIATCAPLGERFETFAPMKRRAWKTGGVRNVIKLPTPPVKEWPPEMVARCERLSPYRGQYVAETQDEVLFGATDPREVVAWLRERGIRGAAIMFVPFDPSADLPLPR